jgi:excinuclease ABC subunit C
VIRSIVSRLPAAPGVYRFADERGRTLYVGRAVDLRRRVASYWSDLRDRRHLRRMVTRIDRIDAIACASGHEAAWLERNVLERSLPPWNRTPGGAEVPLSIVVTREPPSMRTAHDARPGSLTFGPYLGGTQVRLAMSGILRVFPVHYAGSGRLTAAERDLARARGVLVGAGPAYIDAVIGVLRGSGATLLLAQLAARRDAAAAALGFELAGRIQEEIEAVEWIKQEQRVHRPGGVDAVAYGYADGFLLRLEVHGGRLDGWRVRRASPRTAKALVAATSPEWREFAQRNAELAAALHSPA